MIKKIKYSFAGLARARLIQHLAFWAFSFLVLVNILRASAEIQRIDVIYALVFHLPILLVVYFNESLLFPRLLTKNKYGWYLLSVAILLLLGTEFYLQLFERWIDYLFPGYYFIAYYNFFDMLLFLSVYLVLTTLIKLARAWFRLNQMEQEKTSNELKVLRSQLNPHFLFNSLNNLYTLTRKKSDKAPEMVLKLSDILRYVIYDAETNFISLEKELDFLGKYIEVQRVRLDKGFQLKIDLPTEMKGLKIAPLLFLPFIENAFKYGVNSGSEKGKISIHWEITGKQISFYIENEKVLPDDVEPARYKGMGIKNVQKRLELIYPGRHELEIEDLEHSFVVRLKIGL
jgi:sensor histidine kinase YesM